MSYNFILLTAFRYFSAKKANKLVSFISGFSLLGVMIGVAALIVVMAVMEGFHIQFTANMIGIGGDINISPITRGIGYGGGAEKATISNYEEKAQDLEKLDGIEYALPQIHDKALVIFGSNSSGVMIRGVRENDLALKSAIIEKVLAGDIGDIYDGYGIAVGKGLAINLGIRVGDEVTILVSNNIKTMLGSLPRKKTFKVASVFSSPMFDYDASTMIVSLESAQKLFSMKDQVNIIEVYTDKAQDVNEYTSLIQSKIGYDYNVYNWQNNNASLLNALKIERVTMFTILSLIILVAAFNIISSLFMLVNEKRRDIAILKTIGATRSQIISIFIINGSLVGIIGTILGVSLGVLLATNIDNIRMSLESVSGLRIFDSAIYMLYHLPSNLVASNIIYISVMATGLSILATIYPAMKAASIDPCEALKDE